MYFDLQRKVLVFGNLPTDAPGVAGQGRDFRVPHRGISRAYNLVGLADLDPSVRVPGLGFVADLLAGRDLGGVREYEDGEEAVPVTLRGQLRGAREG